VFEGKRGERGIALSSVGVEGSGGDVCSCGAGDLGSAVRALGIEDVNIV